MSPSKRYDPSITEPALRDLWQRLGLSIDWRYSYRTIDEQSRKTSQWSFLDLYQKGLAYRREAPTPTASIAAERVMYFHKPGVSGCTDIVGEAGPSSHAVYSLPDVYTGPGFEQWLMLLNPNSHAEVVAITFFADNTIVQMEITLPATSRTSILLNSIVTPLANAYPNSAGYGASLEIQAFDSVVNGQTLKSTIVVESGMYFQTSKPGGFEMLGYAGG